MTKEELETAIKLDNLWSGRSTLVLAIGILGEYVVLPFLKGGHKAAKIFFAVLVVAGIVGEYEFSSFISQDAEDLQRISDTELTDATNTAGKAIERAAKADLQTALLRTAIADRNLTADQQRKIGTALAKYGGRSVWVSSYPGDPEAARLGREIISALHVARIEAVDRLGNLSSGNPMLFGIEVQCAENGVSSQRDFAAEIISALSSKDSGNLTVRSLSEFGCHSEYRTEIEVGIKPPTLVE